MSRQPAGNRPVSTDDTGRPVRLALTREYIVRTALAILDRDGVAGLSMRKLAAELGTNPMAFYHHLPNKAALFDGVVEAAYAEIDIDIEALARTGTWRDMLTTFARSLRDVLRHHPHVLAIIATRPAYAPSILGLADRALGGLRGSGFTDRDLLVMVNALRAFTIGHVLAEVGEPVGGPTPTEEEAVGLLDRYPNLARAVSGGYQPQEQFEQVLQAMLDGFEQWSPPRTG
ncbi:TetR/AcrR family transcriptional regulator [Nonomuraea sp. NPDC048916]|uniref:TetR/AcrR family transcriptional regulator n=1 Tax=Nonomuraea sp. NPDC048916 TaxID=3154232 RepID=UPI00340DC266